MPSHRWRHAGGDDDGPAAYLVPAGDRHRALRPLGAPPGRRVPVDVFGAEVPGLRVGPYREILAAHPGRETPVVADARAHPGLAADGLWLQHHRGQALGCPVDRGRQGGRPGTDHRHVVQAAARAGLHPDGLGELSVRRILQHPPVEHDHHRQRRRGGAGLFQQHLSRPAPPGRSRTGPRCGSAGPGSRASGRTTPRPPPA